MTTVIINEKYSSLRDLSPSSVIADRNLNKNSKSYSKFLKCSRWKTWRHWGSRWPPKPSSKSGNYKKNRLQVFDIGQATVDAERMNYFTLVTKFRVSLIFLIARFSLQWNVLYPVVYTSENPRWQGSLGDQITMIFRVVCATSSLRRLLKLMCWPQGQKAGRHSECRWAWAVSRLLIGRSFRNFFFLSLLFRVKLSLLLTLTFLTLFFPFHSTPFPRLSRCYQANFSPQIPQKD